MAAPAEEQQLEEEPPKEELGKCDQWKLSASRWRCTRAVASFGLPILDEHRVPIIRTLMVLQSIGTIFCIVGAFGVSTNSSILKSMPWASYQYTATDGAHGNVYLNLAALRVDAPEAMGGGSALFKYDDWDDAWDDGEQAGSDWYQEIKACKEASTACVTTIMMNAVLHSFQVGDSMKRVHRETDHGCNKVMGAITPVLNGLFLLIAILEFSTKCVSEISSDVNPVSETCYILMIIVCIMDMCIVFPILMLTPAPYTPDEDEDECDADEKTAVEGNQEVILLPAMGENNEPMCIINGQPVYQDTDDKTVDKMRGA